jgi:hypothetical protein
MFGWIYTVDKTIVGSLWLIYVDITLVSRCYMIEFINLLVEIPSSIGRTPLLWGFESPTLGDICDDFSWSESSIQGKRPLSNPSLCWIIIDWIFD